MKAFVKKALFTGIAVASIVTTATPVFAEESEWGIIPDDYVFTVPSSGYTVTVGGNADRSTSRSDAAYTEPEEEAPSVDSGDDFSLEEFAEYHLKRINEIRAEYGLKALSTDPVLTEMAQERINEYRLGHRRADGSDWYTIFDDYNTDLKPTGENWAASTSDPETQIKAFLSSEGHRSNMLCEDAAYVGIGVKLNEDGTAISVVQLFAR